VIISFDGVQAPELPDIIEGLTALHAGSEDIVNAASAFATVTRAHHDDLVDVRAKFVAGAFPLHHVSTSTDNTSVHVSVDGDLSDADVYNADTTFRTTFNNSPLFGVLAKTDFIGPHAFSSLPKLKALAELPLLIESGNETDNTALHGELDTLAGWEPSSTTMIPANLSALDNLDPLTKMWATAAVKYGNQAGIDPRLVLAIVLNEGATRTHYGLGQPYDEFFRWPGRSFRPNSLGLTNMKEAQFNEVKKRYPDEFKGVNWGDLVGNDDLAIKSTSYNLTMLRDDAASQANPSVRLSQPLNQFLASGYNASGQTYRSLSIARDGDTFKANEADYGIRALGHYDDAKWKTPLPATIPFSADHRMDSGGIVGSGTPTLTERGLEVVGRWASTPRAQEVRQLVAEKHLQHVSVEFLRHSDGTGKVSRELVGGSFVYVPSNPEAKVLASKSIGAELLSLLAGRFGTKAAAAPNTARSRSCPGVTVARSGA
jgi:hypothetical protein